MAPTSSWHGRRAYGRAWARVVHECTGSGGSWQYRRNWAKSTLAHTPLTHPLRCVVELVVDFRFEPLWQPRRECLCAVADAAVVDQREQARQQQVEPYGGSGRGSLLPKGAGGHLAACCSTIFSAGSAPPFAACLANRPDPMRE